MQPIGQLGVGSGANTMGSGGGNTQYMNGMTVQEMQQLQQQIAQQLQRNQQQSSSMGGTMGTGNTPMGTGGAFSHLSSNSGSTGAPGFVSGMNSSFLQQQQFRSQSSSGPGNQLNSAAALALMQQQQQQQQQQMNAGLGGNNMSSMFAAGGGGPAGSWNQQQNSMSSIDASMGSSARLLAMSSAGDVGGSFNSGAGHNLGAGMMESSTSNNNNMGGSNSSPANSMQSMQMLFQQQQQRFQQQTGVGGGLPSGLLNDPTGNNNNSHLTAQQLLLQRQLAHLQGNAGLGGNSQQQHQRSGSVATNAALAMQAAGGSQSNMGGFTGSAGLMPDGSSNIFQAQQQQLLQQMQQQQLGNNGMPLTPGSDSMMQQMMQQSVPGRRSSAQLQGGSAVAVGMGMNSIHSLAGTNMGALDEHRLRLHQQNLLKSADVSQPLQQIGGTKKLQQQSSSMGSDNDSTHSTMASQLQMGSDSQRRVSFQNPQQQQGGSGNNLLNSSISAMSAGMPGLRQTSFGQQLQAPAPIGSSSSELMNDLSSHSHGSAGTPTPLGSSQHLGFDQPSIIQESAFLDGTLAGGWQSNLDMGDRRKIIFKILELIRQMRPEAKASQKLPHMAKSLEEHLYRSAKTKEEYMDFSTLKERLQAIAHGLELHRSSGSHDGSMGSMYPMEQGVNNMPQSSSMQQGSPAFSLPNSDLLPPSSLQPFQLQDQQQQPTSTWSGGFSNSMGPDNLRSFMAPVGSMDSQPLNATALGATQEKQHGMTRVSSIGEHIRRSTSHRTIGESAKPTVSMGQNAAWSSAGSGNSPSLFGNLGGNTGNGLFNASSMLHGQGDSAVGQQQQGMQAGFPQLGSSFQGNMNTFPNQINSQGNPSSLSPLMPTTSTAPTNLSNIAAQGSINNNFPSLTTAQEAAATAQKQKVILQQQQRLLLLRHASKCTAGPSCTTKFCNQMVNLWKHMKTCRDKTCKTPHCLSSRCVLNHYRICKSNANTMSCEVCGPVMMKIKQQDDSLTDPLTKDHDGAPARDLSTELQSSSEQLQQAQQQQIRFKVQLGTLKELQKQQEQLLEQRRALDEQSRQISDPHSPQALQLQQQQLLLQQLQKRCQQQLLLLQQELQLQSFAGSHTVEVNPGLAFLGTENAQSATLTDLESTIAKQSTSKRRAATHTKRESGKGKRGGKGGKTLKLPSTVLQGEVSKKRGSASSGKDALASKLKETSTAPVKQLSSEDTALDPASMKLLEESTLISSMTKDEIEKHLESLNKRIRLSSRTVTHKCMPMIQALIDDQYGWVFHEAVDPVAFGLPDYYEVIKTPMHLQLVKKKLENAIYSDMEGFARDVRLVFENAIMYNGETSEVGGLAQRMLSKFSDSFASVMQEIESSQQNLESQGELCSLCGHQKRLFEPTVLYCQGKCGMQPIKRHASYFTDRTKQNHWCQACYMLLSENDGIVLDDGSEVRKGDLQELKNDALPEEAWVNCDDCQSWVHQICALFNGRTNKSKARYTCPHCYLRKSLFLKPASSHKMKGSAELARCMMSDSIESGLSEALRAAYIARAEELGVALEQVEKADGLSVRVLSNVDKKQLIGERMLRHYESIGCPREFSVRSKCIALFQKIHGVDTLLFAMYVYEYGQECPTPNKRRVYISYLDSVQYFEPKCYRTTVYHTILVEYLRYVKRRGFHTAHIWSCPPTPGDDYIFYCHPAHQLTPREDMLRVWYHRMLDKAKALGIVIRTTTLFDEYFKEDSVDPAPGPRSYPTCLPYFEGDYIPGEIETILKHMESQQISVSRSGSVQDEVMLRLGQNLGKMKENFIVVHLRNRRFAAAVERGEDVSQWREDSDEETVRSKRAKISGKDSSVLYMPKTVENTADGTNAVGPRSADANVGVSEDVDDSTERGVDADDLDPIPFDIAGSELKYDDCVNQPLLRDNDGNDARSTDVESPDRESTGPSIGAFSGGIVEEHSSVSDKVAVTSEVSASSSPNEQETRAQVAKRGFDEMKPAMSKHFSEVNRGTNPVGDTTDEDEPFESEMFESRQQFLNYCQTNHCQFDDLRRAKHSAMMVLFQLHNPSAPKFLQQCCACYREITHGIRYHCNQCSNFDLCQECYEPVTSGQWAQKDARFAHDSSHSFTPFDMETDETSATRDEIQRNLKTHIDLLEHAGRCGGMPQCSLHNCRRMKELFKHVDSCDMKPKKDCKVCNRLISLCAMHSRMCAAETCPIPFCDRIRERNKRLRRQQQLMDDRRRQAQNELYQASG